jgi:hypothetical protein
LELLLEQWDKSREIERDEIYRDLSVERKLELLSYLAVKKFEQEQYVLFEQAEIERYIAEFLQIGQRDSRVVLRAIESQHGLLIERSQKVWSFSHLTFQEYLVTRHIIESRDFHQLAARITYKRWREVFLLTAQMTQYANSFIQLMKNWIDKIIANSRTIQQFLDWIKQEADYVDTPYKLAAVRAFYICYYDREVSDSLTLKLDSNLATDYYSALNLCDDIESDLGHELDEYQSPKDTLIAENIRRAIKFAIARSIIFNTKIRYSLKQLHKHSYYINQENDNFFEPDWDDKLCEPDWEETWEAWREELCYVIDGYHSWIHDWEFEDEQERYLQDYYYANKLLIDCIDNTSGVTPEVQHEIEETLLLPLTEIENRKCTK